MNLFHIYAIGVAAMLITTCIRAPEVEVRPAVVISALWVVFAPYLMLGFVLDAFGWILDADVGKQMFGFRKPTNPEAKGFAVTVLFVEIQLYKIIKE